MRAGLPVIAAVEIASLDLVPRYRVYNDPHDVSPHSFFVPFGSAQHGVHARAGVVVVCHEV